MGITCNTCNSDNHEKLFSNRIESTSRMQNVPQDVLICKDCGQVFLDISNITEEDLKNYYSQFNPFEVPQDLVDDHRPLRYDQTSWLMDRLPKDDKKRKILDVGCGAGFFLRILKDNGFDVEGVEFSEKMAETVEHHHKIKCQTGGFNLNSINGKFDVITSITVLEHVWNPNKQIEHFAEILNDDGYLFIEVPDAEFPRHDMVPDHLAFEHIHHWTLETLKRLLYQHNFEVLEYAHVENAPDSGNPETVLRVFCKKTPKESIPYEIKNDYEQEKKILSDFKEKHNQYLGQFNEKLEKIFSKIGSEEYAIYCGGQHTSMLLDYFPMPKKATLIFDGDKSISETILNEIKIKHSSEITEHPIKHFLMSTTNHENSIYNFIKDNNPESSVYGLYQDFD